MKVKGTVYKLYKDVSNEPKDSMYKRPICIGLASYIGSQMMQRMSFFENKAIVGMCIGAAGTCIGIGFYNICKFKKQKKEFEMSQQRLDVFKTEAKKILDEDVNLDYNNVLMHANFSAFDSFNHYNTLFKDGGVLMETSYNENYNCEYFKLPENECPEYEIVVGNGINLNSAVDKAYSFVPGKNKKKKDNE